MADETQYCRECEYIQQAYFNFPDEKKGCRVLSRCRVGERVMGVDEMTHMAHVGCRTRNPPKKGIVEEEGR